MRIGSAVIDTSREKPERKKGKTISARDIDRRNDDLNRYEDHFVLVYGGEVRGKTKDQVQELLEDALMPQKEDADELFIRRCQAMARACTSELSRRKTEGITS